MREKPHLIVASAEVDHFASEIHPDKFVAAAVAVPPVDCEVVVVEGVEPNFLAKLGFVSAKSAEVVTVEKLGTAAAATVDYGCQFVEDIVETAAIAYIAVSEDHHFLSFANLLPTWLGTVDFDHLQTMSDQVSAASREAYQQAENSKSEDLPLRCHLEATLIQYLLHLCYLQ